MQSQNTLYSFVDVDRSRKVRWMFCELGMNFDEKRLDWDKKDNKTTEFLAVSPFGLVPGVNIAGKKLFESSAICTYLADQFPEKKLAPYLDSPDRAAYMSWVFFGATTLEDRVMEVIRWRKLGESENLDEAKKDLNEMLQTLDTHLQNNDYLCASSFTTADIITGFPLAVANETGMLEGFPNLQKYVKRLSSRPGAEQSRIFTAKMPSK